MIEIIPNWHPVFVHFTIALFSISTLFYILSHLTSNTDLELQWQTVAKWNLWIGAVITVITVAAGWQAYYTVDHDTPSHVVMTDHRNWAMGTFIFFSLLAVWSVFIHRSDKVKNWVFVGFMIIASGVLLSTAWRGGEVVFRYGLGVMSLPKSTGEGHDHEHADGAGHGSSKEGMAVDEKKDAHDNSDGHHDKPGDKIEGNAEGNVEGDVDKKVEEKPEGQHDNSDGHHDN